MNDRRLALAAIGALFGAVGHSVLIYFLSGIFRKWGQGEGIAEGIFIITIVPIGAVLGALTGVTLCLWKMNLKASAARWSFFGGSIFSAAFIFYGAWDRSYLLSFGPAGLWSISLMVFGLMRIIAHGDL